MKIFAHRGYSSKYPENTIAAFKAAANLPIYGVELDVHLTMDHQLVVIHDEKINRTSNGTGYVKDMTLQQLRQYDFGSWFNEEFKGEKIPTLREVLEIYKGTDLRVNIELKSDVINYPNLEEAVLQEIEAFQMENQVLVSSFNHEAVARMAVLAPHIENAAVFHTMILNVAEYQKTIPTQGIHVRLPTIERKPVIDALKKGSIVRVWTINNVKHLSDLKDSGVDAIFTDYPEEMLNALAKENC